MFKKSFFNLKEFHWIPSTYGNLTGGIGAATGEFLERGSPLGILIRPSFLLPL